MKTQKTILCATLVLLFVLAGSASAATYNVIDLGTLLPGGGSTSWGASINDNGQIAGSAYNSPVYYRACLFDKTGGGANIDLKTLGGPGSASFSINNSGQIVGWAHNGSGEGRACLFDPTGGGANIDLGTGNAFSINNSSQIVGYTGGSPGYGRACLFDKTGGGANIDLKTLGGSYSHADSINNNGQIVGTAINSSGYWRACLFDKTGSGANIDLGGLGGGGSQAFSNNDGQIVGYATNASGYSRACLFDATGGGANIALETVVGFDNAAAAYINDHAQIVGSAWNSPGSTSHAWLFNPMTGDMMDLNTLIDPASNWVLTNATCISNNGWIVGYGINPSGNQHAYLLIPEPATMALLGLGGLALLRRRR